MTAATLQMHIDLSGIAGRVQRVLKQVTYMASIGVRATESITSTSLEMPEVNLVFVYDHSNPWSADEAKLTWRRWILTNAFRDIAEVIAQILEEAQSVLAIWSLLDPIAKSTLVKADRWNKEVALRSEQFHRRTLPQKLDFLRDTYGFVIAPDLLAEAMSINAARNCFVHRGGQVTKHDVDSSGLLNLRWRQMTPYVQVDGASKELVLPYLAKNDTVLSIKVEAKVRSFAIGDQLEITLPELSGICWTLFSAAQQLGEALEAYGQAKGFAMDRKAP